MIFTLEEIELMKGISFDKSLLEIILDYKEGNIRENSPMLCVNFYEGLNIKGIEFDVVQGKSNAAIKNIQKILKNKGYQVYFSVFNDNINEFNTLSILKTFDELDIIRFNSVNGVNHDVFPKDIIEKIQKWNALYGLDITGANNDWIMFNLHSLPEDLDLFVNELVEFCPDYLDQDNYSERGVDWSKFMIRSIIYYHKIVRLWWD